MTFLFNWQLTLPLLAQDLWICCINIQHSSFVMWPQALLSKLKLQFLISEELSWNFCFEMQMCAACLAPGLPPTRLLNTKPYRIRFVNQRDFSESHESFRPVRPRPHRNRQKKARICCKICEMPRMCLHVCFVCEDLHREAKTPCDAGQAKGSSVLFFHTELRGTKGSCGCSSDLRWTETSPEATGFMWATAAKAGDKQDTARFSRQDIREHFRRRRKPAFLKPHHFYLPKWICFC